MTIEHVGLLACTRQRKGKNNSIPRGNIKVDVDNPAKSQRTWNRSSPMMPVNEETIIEYVL